MSNDLSGSDQSCHFIIVDLPLVAGSDQSCRFMIVDLPVAASVAGVNVALEINVAFTQAYHNYVQY